MIFKEKTSLLVNKHVLFLVYAVKNEWRTVDVDVGFVAVVFDRSMK